MLQGQKVLPSIENRKINYQVRRCFADDVTGNTGHTELQANPGTSHDFFGVINIFKAPQGDPELLSE